MLRTGGHFRSIGLSLAAVGLIAAACGGSADEPAEEAEPVASSAVEAVEAEEAPAIAEIPPLEPSVEAPVPEAAVEPDFDDIDLTPPELTVDSPIDGAHVSENYVVFQGATDADATVAVGQFEADQEGDGQWWLGIVLQVGRNRVTFQASDPAGNVTEQTVTVYFDAGPTVSDEPVPGFSAFQIHGSSADDPPYDLFSGEAAPGSRVTVSSAYGSGATTTAANGQWWLSVEFPAAPVGTPIVIAVSDGTHSQTFLFTRVA